MIEKIYETEIDYIKCFCDAESLGGYTRFSDPNIKDMYSHNFVLIDRGLSDEAFLARVEGEIKFRKSQNESYLRVVTHKKVNDNLLSQLSCEAELETYDYYGIQTSAYKRIKERKSATLKCADQPRIAQDGRLVDIIANYEGMTLEFAIRRIDRKFQIYSNNQVPLNLYVCYDGIEPVGNCELMINGNVAKIEDFDIIEMHQRKGYGSYVLRSLLEICHKRNVCDAYLVTDHDDTAKEMYLKNGFELKGQRTELMFKLDKK